MIIGREACCELYPYEIFATKWQSQLSLVSEIVEIPSIMIHELKFHIHTLRYLITYDSLRGMLRPGRPDVCQLVLGGDERHRRHRHGLHQLGGGHRDWVREITAEIMVMIYKL
jgi:hypothetical protein